MDFVAVVDQVIALLRQRGRVTYRTLQLQFTLDDAQLAALKDELLYSQPHVLDDMGRGLVWRAAPEATPEPTLPPPGASLLADTANAERRQLTVLFCDLVDSTRLSTQLDPEDYREIVRAYQQVCATVIQQFEGHIAQYLGDGLLVYFGHPQAHEDDARRAVQAALGILDAMRSLGASLSTTKNVRLAVRIGIHTGLVVVGEIGGAGIREQLALGDTPNIAARLQGLAAPDTVVISEATARLSQGYFVWQALGAQTLKVEQGIALYDPQKHRELGIVLGEDFGVACLCFVAMVLLWLGYPEQALRRSHEALALARELAHPVSLARALVFVTHIHQLRCELPEVQIWTGRAIAHATAQGFPFWVAIATLLQGWGLSRQGFWEEGMARIEQGLTAFRATSGEVAWTSYLALLAEGAGACGRLEEGLLAVDEALGVMEKSGERFYEVELCRLKGDLLLRRLPETASAATQEGESWLLRALDIARQRQAKLSELQVVLSLARLWQQQGQRQAARALLQESYDQFTEGWHTAALQEASAFLRTLEA